MIQTDTENLVETQLDEFFEELSLREKRIKLLSVFSPAEAEYTRIEFSIPDPKKQDTITVKVKKPSQSNDFTSLF